MVLQLLLAQIENILQFRKRLAGPNDPSLEGLKSVSRLSLSLVTWPAGRCVGLVEGKPGPSTATWAPTMARHGRRRPQRLLLL